MGTPLPPGPSAQMFIYYYLITGDRQVALLLANYYPGGIPAKKYTGDTQLWKKVSTQELLKGTVRKMAKKKVKVKKPTDIPEAQIEIVEDVIATAEEVLIYLTACMRGQVKEEVLMTRLCGEGQQIIERLRKEVTPKDRTKAAELLAKRYGLLEHKYSIDLNAPVIFSGESELED